MSGEASGKLVLRLPPALHADLAKKAEQQHISLNTLLVALLAGGIGFKLAKPAKRESKR